MRSYSIDINTVFRSVKRCEKKIGKKQGLISKIIDDDEIKPDEEIEIIEEIFNSFTEEDVSSLLNAAGAVNEVLANYSWASKFKIPVKKRRLL